MIQTVADVSVRTVVLFARESVYFPGAVCHGKKSVKPVFFATSTEETHSDPSSTIITAVTEGASERVLPVIRIDSFVQYVFGIFGESRILEEANVSLERNRFSYHTGDISQGVTVAPVILPRESGANWVKTFFGTSMRSFHC